MGGGLMNLVSQGQQNIILNGNPSKTFFKTTFAQYTNFGKQKFRVDFDGSSAKALRLNEPSTFTFTMPRNADLLMDAFLSVQLPNIWSPIMPPQTDNQDNLQAYQWAPYEYRWIENIGAKMISKIQYVCGNYTLQEYSGDYLLAAVQRDFDANKRALFDEMTGNVPELNNPASAGSRTNVYPNAYYNEEYEMNGGAGSEPSIRGRTLCIPLNGWFGLKTQMAFPLVSLQYNILKIIVTFRPINELFQVRDVMDWANEYPYIAPNFNSWYMQMHRFLQPPPDITLGIDSYTDQRDVWNADIHLRCTYVFLSNEEQRRFALNEQKYLIKQVREQRFYNVTGPNRVTLDSQGLVADWLFYFQRSDANLRNEWSNYTNWPYGYAPVDVVPAPTAGTYTVYRVDSTGAKVAVQIGAGVNPSGQATGWQVTQAYTTANEKSILVSMGILFDGSYRENTQPSDVYNYIEKYESTRGNAPPGLYCYHYNLHADNASLQPSGAININRFSQIELEFTTLNPPLNPFAQTMTICDPETGNVIGINKPTWQIYEYNYDLYLFEERINFIYLVGGNVGLMYAT